MHQLLDCTKHENMILLVYLGFSGAPTLLNVLPSCTLTERLMFMLCIQARLILGLEASDSGGGFHGSSQSLQASEGSKPCPLLSSSFSVHH
jgi:hypothetical protein